MCNYDRNRQSNSKQDKRERRKTKRQSVPTANSNARLKWRTIKRTYDERGGRAPTSELRPERSRLLRWRESIGEAEMPCKSGETKGGDILEEGE